MTNDFTKLTIIFENKKKKVNLENIELCIIMRTRNTSIEIDLTLKKKCLSYCHIYLILLRSIKTICCRC